MAVTFNKIIANWKAFQSRLMSANEPALREVGQRILDRSQELVPVDTGKLKQSAFITSERTATGAKVTVGYAKDGDPDYALIVHENLEAHHTVGQAKFLEQAVFENLGRIPEEYARKVRSKANL